mgnify:CR=1 FL=1
MRDKGEEQDYSGDLELVRRILEGSTAAWHNFLEQYSGLIYGIIRQSLIAEDEDNIRSVYVDTIKSLYDDNFRNYRGEARLSTWLAVYVRNRAVDYFRRRHGRISTPSGYDRLNEIEREILELFILKKLPLEIVAHILDERGFSISAEKIIESIDRIENTLSPRFFKRIEDEFSAKRYGLDSVKMLKYLMQLQEKYNRAMEENRPDSRLVKEERKATAERVRKLISELPPLEREVIYYRFNKGWSAKRIAEKMELGSQRRTYTLISRIIRKIKRKLMADED